MRILAIAIITFVLGFSAALWKLNVSANTALMDKNKTLQADLNRYKSLNKELSGLASTVVDGDYVTLETILQNIRQNNGEASQFINLPLRLIRSINDFLAQSTETQGIAQDWQRRYNSLLDSLNFQKANLSQNQQIWLKTTDSLTFVISKSVQERNSALAELEAYKGRSNFLQFMNKTNKVVYIGEVLDGKANGKGIGVWQTQSIYDGEWKQNLRHGKGKFTWADGIEYEGEFKDDDRHGFGIFRWTNGDIYEGQWYAGNRHGQGKLYNSKTNKVIYEGIWEADEPKK